MKKIILKYFGLAIIFFSALSVWWLVDRIFSASFLDNWRWVIFSISIFFVSWFLGAIIIRDRKLFLGVTFLALASQLIFIRHWEVLIIILISFLALFLTRKVIRRELRSRLKISIWTSLRGGRYFFILVVALMLAGQYYFFENPQIESENLPKVKIDSQTDNFMIKIIALADDDLSNGEGGLATVDEFLFKKIQREEDSILSKESENSKSKNLGSNTELSEYQKEMILSKERENVSKMLEREVAGDEMMLDVFLEIINKKADDFINLNLGYVDQDMPIMHLVFALAIFLAVFGTGTLVSLFLVFLVAVVFRIMIELGLLSIEKKAVNMEIVKVS